MGRVPPSSLCLCNQLPGKCSLLMAMTGPKQPGHWSGCSSCAWLDGWLPCRSSSIIVWCGCDSACMCFCCCSKSTRGHINAKISWQVGQMTFCVSLACLDSWPWVVTGVRRGWVTKNGVIDSCPSLCPLPLPREDRKVICEFMETGSCESPRGGRHRLGSEAGKKDWEGRSRFQERNLTMG